MLFSDIIQKTICPKVPLKEGIRYGVELEYEGSNDKLMSEYLPGWSLTGDDSLRNNGIEFVSHVTLPEHLHTRLTNASKLVEEHNLIPHKRCGVHVHLNVTDLNIRQLMCVSTLYALIEPQIFQNFAPERTDNHFCVPLYNCENLLDAFRKDITHLRNMEAGINAEMKSNKYKNMDIGAPGFEQVVISNLSCVSVCSKYAALNYKTLANLGTLEFRHLGATTDFLLIEAWCEFIGMVREVALKYQWPEDIIDDYENTGIHNIMAEFNLPALVVDSEDQDDAEYLALTICGEKPMTQDQLTWTIGA